MRLDITGGDQSWVLESVFGLEHAQGHRPHLHALLFQLCPVGLELRGHLCLCSGGVPLPKPLELAQLLADGVFVTEGFLQVHKGLLYWLLIC